MKRNLHAGKRYLGGFGLSIFSDDELQDIHLATLEVMQHAGVFVEDEEALEIFHGGGCLVDKSKKIVKLPAHVVEGAISSAPPQIVLSARNPENDFVMGSDRVGFTSFGEGIMVIDPDSGEYRKSLKQDVANSALVVDYLSDVDVYERAIAARDVPDHVRTLHEADAYFNNTSKPCFQGPGSGTLARKLFEMGAIVMGGEDKFKERPPVSCIVCPTSPLRLSRGCCEVIIECARFGVPLNILSMAMAGASSPVTLAGTLVTHNTEVLSGIVLHQLTSKGAPVIYGSSTTCMDLRMTTAPVGSPELGMISAAVAKIAQFYQLPSWVAGA